MAGSEVVITVASMFSMNRAQAMMSGMMTARDTMGGMAGAKTRIVPRFKRLLQSPRRRLALVGRQFVGVEPVQHVTAHPVAGRNQRMQKVFIGAMAHADALHDRA